MSARALKSRFAAPAGKDRDPSHPDNQGGPEEIWSGVEQGRYARSYDLLSDALMAIFEKIYLPLEVMEQNPETGGLRYTAEGLTRFEQLKDRYIVTLRNNGACGRLEVEISPSSSYKGVFHSGIAESYLQGPEEIRNTITTFFTELNEIAAGLPGISVRPAEHLIGIHGPQPFFDMITAICDAKGIVTAEHDHVTYALNARRQQSYGHEGDEPLPDPLSPPHQDKSDMAALTARYIKNNIHSDDEELAQSAQIPEAVLRALSPQNYGWREIGHLVNRFNEQGIVPLFSLRTLQAAVDQDIGAENSSKRPVSYYLH